MRSNRNISARQDGTLKSAEIVSFRQSQSIDNQCLFLCQNVTSFTGKEKDSETGFYYVGARYYDPSLSGLFISVDPMADKYPSISPYAYCAWNPVKLVDPDGNWPWPPYHIREAKKFAKQNHGFVNIEEKRNGVKIANVGYISNSSEYGKIFTLRSFAPKGYNSRGTIKEATGLAKAELWMDEPSKGFIDFTTKTLSSIAYSFFNEPFELSTGHTIAGSDVNYDEKTNAFIGQLFSGMSRFIGKGIGLIHPKGVNGLDRYNNFVQISGGRNGRTPEEMGKVYQKNKQTINEMYIIGKTQDRFSSSISILNHISKVDE